MRLVSSIISAFLLAVPGTLAASELPNYEPIQFVYTDKDCCSCFIEPDICGGGFYVTSVKKRIYFAWFPPKKIGTEKICVQFRIHKNGRVSNIKLLNTKSSPLASSALKAVQDAGPFYPFPEGAPEYVDAELIFPSEHEHILFISQQKQNYDFFQKRLAPYLMNLQNKIRKQWKNATISATKTIVSFTMNEEGKLCDVSQEIPETQSKQIFLSLFQKASPIDLPPGLLGPLRVKFTFDPAIREPFISEVQLLKP